MNGFIIQRRVNNHQLRYNDEGIASGLKGIKIECETCSTEVKTKYRTMEGSHASRKFQEKRNIL